MVLFFSFISMSIRIILKAYLVFILILNLKCTDELGIFRHR